MDQALKAKFAKYEDLKIDGSLFILKYSHQSQNSEVHSELTKLFEAVDKAHENNSRVFTLTEHDPLQEDQPVVIIAGQQSPTGKEEQHFILAEAYEEILWQEGLEAAAKFKKDISDKIDQKFGGANSTTPPSPMPQP